jgi:hypothetical protein
MLWFNGTFWFREKRGQTSLAKFPLGARVLAGCVVKKVAHLSVFGALSVSLIDSRRLLLFTDALERLAVFLYPVESPRFAIAFYPIPSLRIQDLTSPSR